MKLLGIDFGTAMNASGARGFFGERDPYWFHRPLRPFGLDWSGSTFVAKTTTLEPRAGNMPLDGNRPRHWKPDCIAVNFRRAAVLNAVGLSGPGLDALLCDGRWQSRLDPFWLSFMAMDGDADRRDWKAEQAALAIASTTHRFGASFGVQLNLSCPNVHLDPSSLVRDSSHTLRAFRERLPRVPLALKINALVPPCVARDMASDPNCDALVVSNTIPWGKLPADIPWRDLFGEVSPLAKYGGGGLSGAPLTTVVQKWLAEAIHGTTPSDVLSDPSCQVRTPGRPFPVPIVAGGGVVDKRSAVILLRLGASAVEVGSVAIVRPWRVRGIIRAVNLWSDSR